MKLQDLKNRKWNYVRLAFALTMVSYLVLMIVKGFAPFGNRAILYSDAYHQYYPFFVAFRNTLRSGESLLYTWNVGMGVDYLGLISYYVASPLNLFSVILPESWVIHYFSLLYPIKLSLASMFFALFLKECFGKDDPGLVLFGGFYSLCAWALAYQWNIMWLDSFALLPLVILGMIRLLTRRKFLLYTLTLFFSIYINYYIGLFVCIFVLLAFICYQVCRWTTFQKFFADLLLMGVFSVLAIGMTAFLTLPTLAALRNTTSVEFKFPEGFSLNIADENTWKGLLDAMRQVAGNMNGAIKPTFLEGLPNLYCGVFANAFAFLFLMGKGVRIRDKVCAVLLIVFFNLSFIFRQLDYVWHGLHFTNMIPYRFSFLHSFVMLYMAYRAYLMRENFQIWKVILAGALSVALILCADQRTNWIYLTYNGIFLVLYLFVLIYPRAMRKLPEDADAEEQASHVACKEERTRLCGYFLLLVMMLELVLNLVNFGAYFPGTSLVSYPRGGEYTASMIRYMHERERNELFFRAETTHSQSLNDGALNNYNGISTFTSSANAKVTTFMRKLGYGAKETFNRYCFEEASAVSNLFLGLKYMIDREGGQSIENPYFTDLHSYGTTRLLKNNAYLPLGFLAEEELAALSFEGSEDAFIFQNTLFKAATGVEDPVWRSVRSASFQINADDAYLSQQTSDGYCRYKTQNSSGTVTYQYTIERDGFMCVWLDLSKRNNITVSINGTEFYSETYTIPQMYAVGQVYTGDVVEIALACKANETGTIRASAALMNDSVFWQGYEVLAQSTLELTAFSDTALDGTISCRQDGLMYTSIPQNGNWHVYVDGQEVEPVLVGDIMLAIPLTEGYHEISFRYHNRAFALGCMITAVCGLTLGGICLSGRKQKKGRYQK